MTPEQKRVRDNLIGALAAFELAVFDYVLEQTAPSEPLDVAVRIVVNRGHGFTGPEAIDRA